MLFKNSFKLLDLFSNVQLQNTKQLPEILNFKTEMSFKFQKAMTIEIIGF